MNSLETDLRSFLSPDSLMTSKEDCIVYGMDWTKVPGSVQAVVLPRTTDEVVNILKTCSKHRTAVIPSGGRTGLAGGVVGSGREVALSLNRMGILHPVDKLGFTVRVQAGATTQSVHEHCEREGLTWPIDLAAKGTSTIGGNLGTNAGGLRVIRYGMARKWVSALQAVTITGEVLELNRGLEKNNTGYDLMQMIVGSEGTLAVITEATLKLTRVPKNTMVLFFSLADTGKLGQLFSKSRQGPFTILACEFFSHACLNAVESALGLKSRLTVRGDFYMILEIEVEDHPSAKDAVDGFLRTIIDDGIILDGMLAQSSSDQGQIWEIREGITESLQKTAPVKKFDVAVPVAVMCAFLDDIQALVKKGNYDFDLYLFGHFGDGSPHLNLLKRPSTSLETFQSEYKRFNDALFPLLMRHHGSVSAEHGIGLLKKDWVTYSRTPEELRLFKLIKAAFDPEGLLNPGKVID